MAHVAGTARGRARGPDLPEGSRSWQDDHLDLIASDVMPQAW